MRRVSVTPPFHRASCFEPAFAPTRAHDRPARSHGHGDAKRSRRRRQRQPRTRCRTAVAPCAQVGWLHAVLRPRPRRLGLLGAHQLRRVSWAALRPHDHALRPPGGPHAPFSPCRLVPPCSLCVPSPLPRVCMQRKEPDEHPLRRPERSTGPRRRPPRASSVGGGEGREAKGPAGEGRGGKRMRESGLTCRTCRVVGCVAGPLINITYEFDLQNLQNTWTVPFSSPFPHGSP